MKASLNEQNPDRGIETRVLPLAGRAAAKLE